MGPTFTNIIVVDLLPEDELQTGLGLVRHLQDKLDAKSYRSVGYAKIRTEAELETYLLHIRSMARLGCKPVVHIECHGDEARGLRLEHGHFKWSRLLQHLSKINVIAKNNVVLFLSGCYGTGILGAVEITRPCPFLALISADDEVSAGFIQDRVGLFYERLLAGVDFKTSMQIILPAFRPTHAELLFTQAFAAYLKNHFPQKVRQARLERVLSFVAPSEAIRPVVRKQMRMMLMDNRGTLERLGRVFLHEKQHFTYDDFVRALGRSAA